MNTTQIIRNIAISSTSKVALIINGLIFTAMTAMFGTTGLIVAVIGYVLDAIRIGYDMKRNDIVITRQNMDSFDTCIIDNLKSLFISKVA